MINNGKSLVKLYGVISDNIKANIIKTIIMNTTGGEIKDTLKPIKVVIRNHGSKTVKQRGGSKTVNHRRHGSKTVKRQRSKRRHQRRRRYKIT